jgi:hypothetical protein
MLFSLTSPGVWRERLSTTFLVLFKFYLWVWQKPDQNFPKCNHSRLLANLVPRPHRAILVRRSSQLLAQCTPLDPISWSALAWLLDAACCSQSESDATSMSLPVSPISKSFSLRGRDKLLATVLHYACERKWSPSGDSCRTKCSLRVLSDLHEGYYELKHWYRKVEGGWKWNIVVGMAFDVHQCFLPHILNYRKY